MIGMAGNRRTFWYANFLKSEWAQDEYGNTSGMKPIYGNPVECRANISHANGRYTHAMFGSYDDYTHVIGPMKHACGIEKDAVLWIDQVPEINPDGSTDTPHDYVVRHVSESLTHVNIAVQSVNVSR